MGAPVKHAFAATHLPEVVRAMVAEVSVSFAYRQRAALFFSDVEEPLRRLSFPAIGGTSHSHVARSMATIEAQREIITPEREKNYARSLMRSPHHYPLDPENVLALENLVRRAKENGAEAVFAELPLPEILLREYPDGTYDLFLDAVEKTTEKAGARFARLANLGAFPGEEMFRDQSRVNRLGAALYTDDPTHETVAPLLVDTGRWTGHGDEASNETRAEIAIGRFTFLPGLSWKSDVERQPILRIAMVDLARSPSIGMRRCRS